MIVSATIVHEEDDAVPSWIVFHEMEKPMFFCMKANLMPKSKNIDHTIVSRIQFFAVKKSQLNIRQAAF
jgi:hypothetical protein